MWKKISGSILIFGRRFWEFSRPSTERNGGPIRPDQLAGEESRQKFIRIDQKLTNIDQKTHIQRYFPKNVDKTPLEAWPAWKKAERSFLLVRY
uniref:Uncharacterized protein n=1 Tax=Romanomermis culicivorax TaxID=13658 RepID=A0A915HNC8_ROMCU